jgi:hypothetical protein
MNIKEITEAGGLDTKWQSEDGSVTITLQQLLNDIKTVPVKKIEIEKLKKRLLNWGNNPEEWDKVKSVDMTYPPIILMNGNQVDMIVDGNHRVQKAIQMGYNTIDAKLISLNNLPNKYKKVFS